MLIECEPAIKSIIVHLDSENHDIIIEDLDESHLVVKENMVHLLKQKLEDVCLRLIASRHLARMYADTNRPVKRLKETYRPEEPIEDSE